MASNSGLMSITQSHQTDDIHTRICRIQKDIIDDSLTHLSFSFIFLFIGFITVKICLFYFIKTVDISSNLVKYIEFDRKNIVRKSS